MNDTDRDWEAIARARTAYFGLLAHVRDEHGINASGTASQVEIAHMAAHRREGTDWHDDAWRLPDQDQEVAR